MTRYVATREYDVFVAYSSDAKGFSQQLVERLRATGLHVFFDERDLSPGSHFDLKIKAAVESSRIFLFVISGRSVATDSYATTELAWASESHRRLIGIHADGHDKVVAPHKVGARACVSLEGSRIGNAVAAVEKNLSAWPPNEAEPLGRNLLITMFGAASIVAIAWFLITASISERHRAEVKHLVQSARALAEDYIKQNSPMTPEREEALKSVLRSMKFDDGKGYFFVYSDETDDENCVVHGGDSGREGQSFAGLPEADRYIVRMMSKVAHQNSIPSAEEEFLTFPFVKPGKDGNTRVDKLGYALWIQDLNHNTRYKQWWIGTGVYMDDVESTIFKKTAWLAIPLLIIWIGYQRRSRDERRKFLRHPDGIIVTNLKNRVVDANDSACELFGYPRAELLNRSITELVPFSSIDDYELAMRDVEQGRTVCFDGVERVTKSGAHVRVDVTVSPLTARFGRVTRRIHAIKDTVERRPPVDLDALSFEHSLSVDSRRMALVCVRLQNFDAMQQKLSPTQWMMSYAGYREKVGSIAPRLGGTQVELVMGGSRPASTFIPILFGAFNGQLSAAHIRTSADAALRLHDLLKEWRSRAETELPESCRNQIKIQIVVHACSISIVKDTPSTLCPIACAEDAEDILNWMERFPERGLMITDPVFGQLSRDDTVATRASGSTTYESSDGRRMQVFSVDSDAIADRFRLYEIGEQIGYQSGSNSSARGSNTADSRPTP